MRITGYSVDGFGHFRDYSVQDLPAGLVVLCGDNESGKTTLLAFLRAVLFGFPGRRGGEEHYAPLNGGRHGGRVFLQAEDGSWVVDREGGRRGAFTVTSPTGAADEVALCRLLGGADDKLFRNVFAFSLAELQTLNTLTDDAVRSRIFAAGLVGARRSAREVIRSLGSQAEGLFTTARATTKEIPRLQREIEDREAQLRQARANLGRYRELVEEEKCSGLAVADLGDTIRSLRREEVRLQLLLDLWPACNERTEAELRLAELPPVDAFPQDAAVRLERTLAEQKAAYDREQQTLTDWRSVVAERRQLIRTLDTRLRALRPAVLRSHEQVALYRSRLSEAAAFEADQRGAESQLADHLRDLGPEWDEARLAAFDTPLPRQADVHEWEQRLAKADMEVHDAAREAESATQRRRDAEAERDGLRQQLEQLPEVEPDRVAAHEAALRRLRANLGDLRAMEAERKAHENIAEDRRRASRAAAAVPRLSFGGAARWALGVVVIAAAAAVVLFALGSTAVAAAAAVIAVGAGAAAVALRSALRESEAAHARAADQRRELERDLAGMEEALRDLREKEDRLRVAVEQDAAALGLKTPLTSADVEERDRIAREARAALVRAMNLTETLRAAEAALARADAEAERRTDLLRRSEALRRTAHEGWLEWKTAAALPLTLTPAATMDFLRELQAAREQLRKRDAVRDKAQRLREQTGEWEDEVRTLLCRVDAPAPDTGESLISALTMLFKACEADHQARERCGLLQREQRKHKLQLRIAREVTRRADRALASLLAEGGAEEESGFRERMAAHDERTALLTRISALDRQITNRLGTDQDARAVRDELASGRLQAWHDGQSGVADQVLVLESQRDDALRRNTELKREREALERSADVPRLETEIEALRTELNVAARRWAVVKLAKSLVEETLHRYMQERQPGVLLGAGGKFSRVTHGRYTNVMQDGDGESFVVLDAAGRSKSPEQLSRGTAEQLYLSLRFALAEEFARHGAALPLVMDDILVNFDPRRAQATAEILSEMSRQHQVLVFTCHRATTRLLRRHGAEVLPITGVS